MHQDSDVIPKCLHPEISNLLQALTLRALKSIDDNSSERVLDKLDRLTEVVVRAHRTEMAKIDSETTELGAQIAAITADQAGQVSTEQIERLRGIATRLDAIGKLKPETEEDSP